MDSCFSFIFLAIFSSFYNQIQCFNHSICNFVVFKTGCVDSVGSECDTKTNRCICRPNFTIKFSPFCLRPKQIGDNCYASAQCNHIVNAGCYDFRFEFSENPIKSFGMIQKNWHSGSCRCRTGHHLDKTTNSCINKVIGSWCSNLWDCKEADKRLVNAICENNECKCMPNHYYNHSTHDCSYRETYAKSCNRIDDCLHPAQCVNSTCDCALNYHFDSDKTPKCQPNNNLNDIKSEESLDIAKGDRSFEIFILTAIPIIIIFLTIKPCLKSFGKCKPQSDEVIRGSKEIAIKCHNFKDSALDSHQYCREKLQTIEEVVEEIKAKDDEYAIQVDGIAETEKSIQDMSESNELSHSTQPVECAKTGSHSSLSEESKDDPPVIPS